MLRSTDPLQCAVGALYMHLLEMLSSQLDDIEWADPDTWCACHGCCGVALQLNTNSLHQHDLGMQKFSVCCRFNIHLLSSSKAAKTMSYQQHWKALVALFAKCGVITSKATHLFRGASARELHAKGSAAIGMPPCRAALVCLAGRHAIKPLNCILNAKQ